MKSQPSKQNSSRQRQSESSSLQKTTAPQASGGGGGRGHTRSVTSTRSSVSQVKQSSGGGYGLTTRPVKSTRSSVLQSSGGHPLERIRTLEFDIEDFPILGGNVKLILPKGLSYKRNESGSIKIIRTPQNEKLIKEKNKKTIDEIQPLAGVPGATGYQRMWKALQRTTISI
jgi:hypothetical protein